MNRVLVLVEGPTERAIIQQVFAPHLKTKGVLLDTKVVGKPGHEGGNDFGMVHHELKALLYQEPTSVVTMFFDYYGLEGDWPGKSIIVGTDIQTNRRILEDAILQTIIKDMGKNFIPDRFIPYIQFHEVEGLLFTGPTEMAEIFEQPKLKTAFEKIVKDCGGCEKINNNYNTKPSKRIQDKFPAYKKGSSVNAHAWRILQHIGVERIRNQCPNFNEWYSKLERLGE
jgi:hypothetical protein